MTYHPYRQPEFSDEPPRCTVCGKKAEDPVHSPGSEEGVSDLDEEVERILSMSDEEVLALAVQEYGSQRAVDTINGLWRRIMNLLVDGVEQVKTIESLQQRCAELEAECKRAWGTADHVLNNNPDLKPRIAALEAALKDLVLHVASTGWVNEALSIDDAQARSETLSKAEALTSSEGAGECPHGCVEHQGSMLIRRAEWGPGAYEPCPIHSPTSAAEDREDG